MKVGKWWLQTRQPLQMFWPHQNSLEHRPTYHKFRWSKDQNLWQKNRFELVKKQWLSCRSLEANSKHPPPNVLSVWKLNMPALRGGGCSNYLRLHMTLPSDVCELNVFDPSQVGSSFQGMEGNKHIQNRKPHKHTNTNTNTHTHIIQRYQ